MLSKTFDAILRMKNRRRLTKNRENLERENLALFHFRSDALPPYKSSMRMVNMGAAQWKNGRTNLPSAHHTS